MPYKDPAKKRECNRRVCRINQRRYREANYALGLTARGTVPKRLDRRLVAWKRAHPGEISEKPKRDAMSDEELDGIALQDPTIREGRHF